MSGTYFPAKVEHPAKQDDLFITAGFFCLTTFFYKEQVDSYKSQCESFFQDLETPVIADEAQNEYDRQQRDKLGSMVICMGTGILLMALIPNPLWGRIIFVFCTLVISSTGFMLKRSARLETVSVRI